jgi:hypothetical protein
MRPASLLATALLLAMVGAARAEPAEDIHFGPIIDLEELSANGSAAEGDVRLCADAMVSTLLGTVRAGAIILTRDRAASDPSARIVRSGDGATLVEGNDFQLGTAAGPDITLLTPIGASLEAEVRFFCVTGWNNSRSASDPSGVQLEGYGLTAPGLSERIDYSSRLYNLEINLRPRIAEGLPLVIGFRTLQLHEWLEAWREGPEQVIVGTSVSNFLYGLQVGAEPYLLGGGVLQLNALVKAGIYGNVASQTSFSPVTETTVSASQDRVSFVGDVGLTLVYRFSQFFEVRAGYELLWIEGVALAPEQSTSTGLPLPASASVHCSAGSFYQGATVALGFLF